MPRLWIAFSPYIFVSAAHVVALALGFDQIAAPTKLALMPVLALCAMWAARGLTATLAFTLLYVAIAFSWLGDGAGTFFVGMPEVPMMLLCFGLAHVAYIWLFWREVPLRRVPPWALVYAVWYGVLLAVLWPHLGGLLVPVALYGLVLGGTAVAASRCHPLIVWGGVLFLASDSILAFRLFLPDAMPDWTSPLVMLTYTAGQGLLAAGVVVSERLGLGRESRLRTAAP